MKRQRIQPVCTYSTSKTTKPIRSEDAVSLKLAQEEIEKHERHIRYVLMKINKAILDLPENKDIKHLGNNCFSIRSSNLLSQSWSPSFYKFKEQYKAIVAELEKKQTATKKIKTLKNIITSGKIRIYSSGHIHYIQLHQKVIEYLKKIY